MKRRRRINAQMNVVPYIDVMLVLLVIFMVTAPLLQPGVVNLPKVGQAAAVEQEPLEIVVGKNKRYQLKDTSQPDNSQRDLTLTELSGAVQRALDGGSRPVVISAEGKIAYAEVMKVVDHLQKHDVARVGLLVNTGR